MDTIRATLSELYSGITGVRDWAVSYITDNTGPATVYATLFVGIVVAIFTYLNNRPARKLARLQAKQILNEQNKTTLQLRHEWDIWPESILCLINAGRSTATGVKISIAADDSQFFPYISPSCITDDKTWFQCEDLQPSEIYQLRIRWNNGENKSKVEWGWRNADGTLGSGDTRLDG